MQNEKDRICGAAETVLIDKNMAKEIVPDLVDDLSSAGCGSDDHEIKDISNQALKPKRIGLPNIWMLLFQ